MQLLYVFIGGHVEVEDGPYAGEVTDTPYKVFKNEELNLSNKFILSFNKETNILDIKLNEQFLSSFFDSDDKIKSVSAIIGKNGTGKTSIIELIKWLQADNLHKIPYKLILVYGNIGAGINQEFTVLKNDELNCELSQNFSDLIEIKEFYSHNKGVRKEFETYESTPEIAHIKQIYYSPVFEVQFLNIKGEHEVFGDGSLIDISTSGLVESDAEGSINGNPLQLTSRQVLVRHKMADVERQYELIKDVNEFENLLGFEKPNFIEVIIDTSDIKFIESWEKVIEFNQAYPNDVTRFNPTAQNYFSFHLLKHSLYNLFREFPSNTKLINRDEQITKIIEAIPRVDEGMNLQQWINLFKQNCANANLFFQARLNQRFDLALSFLELDIPDKRFRYADNTRARLNISNIQENKILLNYFDTKNLTGFIHLDWKYNFYNNGQLSSGQKAKFDLFSRFHSVLKKAERRSQDLSNILILIDEGDTLFHPEWQRTFLNDLFKGIKMIFNESDSIQFVVTTHSPFVSSDLPWYSVIKLDKDEETGLTRVEYDKSKPSFAGNIHDLFKDNFYMEKGFVGEFARTKINKLYKRISDIGEDDDPIKFKNEIALIGEPFVQFSLNQHLENKLNQL